MVFLTNLLNYKRHITESDNGYVPYCFFCNAVFSQSTSKICTLIRFTLFSNYNYRNCEDILVLLPYRFTLFSNAEFANQNLDSVLLPYRFTLFSNLKLGIKCTHYTVHGKSIRLFYNICIMIVNKIRTNHYQSQQGVPCCNPAWMFS